MKVIGIGDNVCDKYIHLKTMFPGGQALNFAAYAGMLGADAAYYFNPFEHDKKNVTEFKNVYAVTKINRGRSSYAVCSGRIYLY